jgi:hypothetical protein
MIPNECCNDMFSHLNLIVKEHNSLNVSNLDKGMINHKILKLIPKLKYNIINSMLQKEDLNKIKVVELVEEIRVHEMNVFGISEKPTTSNSIAFKANAKKTPKLKIIKHEMRSSEQKDYHKSTSSDKHDDQELELLMRKFSRLSNKIVKKIYSFDPKKGVFHSSGSDKNKTCYNCGENGHNSPNCFKPIKKISSSKNKQVQESSDDEKDNHKDKNKSYEKKKSYYKKTKLFPKKKKGKHEKLCCWNPRMGDRCLIK